MNATVAAILATFAALGARTDEINLKSLAVNWDDSGTTKFVLGTGDYSDSKWSWTKERVFDGEIELDNGGTPDWRWFEPGSVHSENENAWAGYGVTEPVVVTGIRFMPRHDEYATRAIGCRFEGANKSDFSDAVTLYTIPSTDAATLQAGWQTVGAAALNAAAMTTSFSYLRVIGDFCGNMIEVEFYGQTWAEATGKAPAAAPQNLALAVDDVDTDAVTLTWNAPTVPCISTLVIRSTAPGGSTFEVTNTLAATTTTYTDSDAVRIPGVNYYYRVAFASGANVGPASGVVSHRHVAEISVTPGSGGMRAIEYDHDYEAATATSAANLFDGDTTTRPDVVNASNGNTGVAVGVDFGEGNECVVTRFAVFPSREWNNNLGENGQWVVGRSDGIVLNGSNDTTDWKNGAAISAACDLYEENTWDDTRLAWHAFDTMDAATAYRYVYLTKPARGNLEGQRTDEFYGNVRELKLYGWNAANAAAVLLAPEISSVQWKGSEVKLAWSAAQNATGYRIERKRDNGAWEAVSTVTATEYTDASIARPTKGTYAYRIASIDGSASVAYTLGVVPTGTPSPRGFVMAFR